MSKLLNSRPDDGCSVRIDGPVARKLLRIGMPSSDVFFLALIAGDIAPSITPANALSRDVFALYRTWCTRLGRKPMSMPTFVHALQRDHKIRQSRMRYRLDDKRQGPHGVLFLGGTIEPLDAQIARFRAGVLAYQEAAHA